MPEEAEQAEREQKRERSVAVVGLLATAVLGLAGIGASWLISRDDRATQRALAHDARVYSAEAAVYEESFRSLSKSNLSDLDPPRAFYLMAFSHPTAPERIANGRRWAGRIWEATLA